MNEDNKNDGTETEGAAIPENATVWVRPNGEVSYIVEDEENDGETVVETLPVEEAPVVRAPLPKIKGVIDHHIETIMSTAYVNYAKAAITSRALPDVRDGLKPVHRRIIYGMYDGGYKWTGRLNKSARSVGDVMGKFHPHGDGAIYDAMVRLGQEWIQRHVLIEGQGNFGSRDGDPPAASRYTESRLDKLTEFMLLDIEKDTVSWSPNYDGTLKEPDVLPARFPNILVNGQEGISVGMATKIPTHNLGEVIDACKLVLERPDATLEEIMAVLPGPDFPTGGVIMGVGGIRQAFATGRGSIRISGRARIEEMKGGKSMIVVHELPYNVGAESFAERVAELANEKQIDGITDVRNESSRDEEIRVVIELRRDVDPNIVLNFIKKKTALVTSFGYNAVVINSRGEPGEMALIPILQEFIAFRKEVIGRRTVYELNAARDALHKQIGLYAAVTQIDHVIRTIRASDDRDHARAELMSMDFPTDGDFAQFLQEADPDTFESVGPVFKLSEIQAKAILELRLQSLSGLQAREIHETATNLSLEIADKMRILNDSSVLNSIISDELDEVKGKFATPRITEIDSTDWENIDDEDLIERKDVVVTITRSNYAKRTDLDAYREQKRGGKGSSGMDTKENDDILTTLVCTTKTPILFFTSRGIAHYLKAHKLRDGNRNARGYPLQNLVPLRDGETITAIIPLPEDKEELESKRLVFVTDKGTVRTNDAKVFGNVKSNGLIAIKLEDDNGNPQGNLISVLLAEEDDDVMVVTEKGYFVRFPVTKVRVFRSRASEGVKAISLQNGDTVKAASILRHEKFESTLHRDAYFGGGTVSRQDDAGNDISLTLPAEEMADFAAREEFLITVSALGFGKRTSAYEYRITDRGAKGSAASNISSATGPLVDCFKVKPDDGLVIITDGGQIIRTRVKDVRITGRTARGVRMFKMPDGQRIVSVSRISAEDLSDIEVTPIEDDASVE
ncbi:DNA gyrase subunit A [Agrobacterium rubi]|nr:DNA gyrase subunit A [Agrobacterium rubi]NTF24410.1 DNA gyrase subunit A [Agrobacterium rubi]